MTLDIRGPVTDRPRPGRRRPLRRVVVAGTLGLVALGAVVTVTARDDAVAPPTASPSVLSGSTRARAVAFLDDWVDRDGRVVRRDQGGDTVSEGQAYGLLLALAVGDRSRFAAIWTWTRTHLQRADGSLAYLWRDGAVRDAQPASDADVDAATALLRAGDQWDDPALTAAGTGIGTALVRSSTVAARPGRLLTGGPWAVGDGDTPARVGTDYVVAGSALDLAAATGEADWRQVATGTRAMQGTLLAGADLPPDWVSLRAGDDASGVVPSGAPGTDGAPQYGVSAPRLFVRLAASCSAPDRALAAGSNELAASADAVAIRALDGTARVGWTSPVTTVGAAAIATARGDAGTAGTLLAAAAAQEVRTPTYYGAAWVALGSVLLRSDQLGSCAGSSPR